MIDKRMMYSQGKKVRNISLQEAKDMAPKGEFLAYINKKEAKMLKDAGGSGIMTNAGIPSYRFGDERDDAGFDAGRNADNFGGGGNGGENRPDRTNPNVDTRSTSFSPPTTTTPRDNDGPQNQIPIAKPIPTFNIHGGPTYKAPPKVPPHIGPSYDNTLFNTQRLKNIELNKQLLNTPYSFGSKIPTLNFLGNTLGKFGYNVNTKFFVDKNIGGKINPKTNKPFGYGIDGYKAYMEQRSLGNVGAYGGTELSQNEINASSGGDDGIMDVYNNLGADTGTDTGTGDADGDGDVDQDDFIFRYFDKTGETLQAGAGGVEDLMTQIRQRISNIFS